MCTRGVAISRSACADRSWVPFTLPSSIRKRAHFARSATETLMPPPAVVRIGHNGEGVHSSPTITCGRAAFAAAASASMVKPKSLKPSGCISRSVVKSSQRWPLMRSMTMPATM
jgi:hypothetical protein